MTQLIESLKRLYANQSISKEKIAEMYNKEKITKEEMNYVLK